MVSRPDVRAAREHLLISRLSLFTPLVAWLCRTWRVLGASQCGSSATQRPVRFTELAYVCSVHTIGTLYVAESPWLVQLFRSTFITTVLTYINRGPAGTPLAPKSSFPSSKPGRWPPPLAILEWRIRRIEWEGGSLAIARGPLSATPGCDSNEWHRTYSIAACLIVLGDGERRFAYRCIEYKSLKMESRHLINWYNAPAFPYFGPCHL